MLRQPAEALTTVISAVMVTSSTAPAIVPIAAAPAQDRGAAEHHGRDRGQQIGIADADIALAVHAEQQQAGEPGRDAADR